MVLIGKMESLRNLSTFIIIISSLLLFGCDQFSPKTIAQICAENPKLCSDLNPDAWCRAEKANIINHRYQHANSRDDQHKYALLTHFEKYQVCIGKAVQIKHLKLREKETGRMMGYLTSKREIARLSKETRHSKDPYLAYYQWSRHGHQDALKTFLRAAEEGELKSAALNVAHATYLVKKDSALAINALYTALSLYTDDEPIDPEIFDSLYTLHTQRVDLFEAIVWGLVGAKFNSNTIDKKRLYGLAKQNRLAMDQLTMRADSLHSQIESRDFSFSR